MPYLRTKEATDWEREPKTSSFFDSNPDYRRKWHLVKEWLIEFVELEFSEYGSPDREIGLDRNGEPVLANSDYTNYGFWCDTNLTWKDVVEERFIGEEISRVEFEKAWESYIEKREETNEQRDYHNLRTRTNKNQFLINIIILMVFLAFCFFVVLNW